MGAGLNRNNTTLSALVLLTIIKAFTPQKVPVFDWLFTAAWTFFALLCAWNGINELIDLFSRNRRRWKNAVSGLAHCGIFVFILATLSGSISYRSEYLQLYPGHLGATEDFVVALESFKMEEYPPETEVISPDGSAGGQWEVELETIIDKAMPDSNGFRAIDHTGAVTAAYVTASNENVTVNGWVSDGSFLLDPVHLQLPDGCVVVMKDRQPIQYISELRARSKGRSEKLVVSAGNPASFCNWEIYQSGYDKSMGRWSLESDILCVKDIWSPVKYAGLWMLLLSGLLMLAGAPAAHFKAEGKSARSGLVISGSVIFALIFTYIIISQLGIGRKKLPPILHSGWFIPHLAAYISGYAVMATATVAGIRAAMSKKGSDMTDILVRAGWGLLTLGLVIGAIWAKRAWGNFWSWDPKETWAAATWLCYLLYMHMPKGKSKTAILIIAFLLLQMCWWGLSLLPSGMNSMHVY